MGRWCREAGRRLYRPRRRGRRGYSAALGRRPASRHQWPCRLRPPVTLSSCPVAHSESIAVVRHPPEAPGPIRNIRTDRGIPSCRTSHTDAPCRSGPSSPGTARRTPASAPASGSGGAPRGFPGLLGLHHFETLGRGGCRPVCGYGTVSEVLRCGLGAAGGG